MPKVFKNPVDGSAYWAADTEYEPLTIVVVNSGDSYTSRQAVPRSIGSPEDNPDYWAKTGDFNASLLALQNRVTRAEEDIDTNAENILDLQNRSWLKGKNVVAYGDSTIVANQGGTGESYIERACRLGGATITNRGVSGTCIHEYSNSGTELIDASTDLTDYDYIFICYGTNEWTTGMNIETIRTELIYLYNSIHSKNSEIQVVFVLPPYSYHTTPTTGAGLTLEDVVEVLKRRMKDWGWKYIDLYHRSTCAPATVDKLMPHGGTAWGVHPTPYFRTELASIVLEGFDSDIDYQYVQAIDNLDFVNARNKASSYYPGAFTGYALYVESESKSSTKTFDGNTEWSVVGEVLESKTATISIGNAEFTISGKFEVKARPSFSLGQISVAGTNVKIKDFMVYAKEVVSRYPRFESFEYNNGAVIKAIKQTENVSDDLKISRVKDGIQLDFQALTITAGTYTSGTALWKIPSAAGINMQLAPFYINSSAGVIILIVSGDTISFGDNYTFGSNVGITLPKMQILNTKYPAW